MQLPSAEAIQATIDKGHDGTEELVQVVQCVEAVADVISVHAAVSMEQQTQLTISELDYIDDFEEVKLNESLEQPKPQPMFTESDVAFKDELQFDDYNDNMMLED